ncbi:MAG: GTP-binding protein [Lachnospiraceae bacterium]|nr:GTP-binding protein [Lachnospiraceae bacterium]
MTKIDIVSGFLGAGKTTLIQKLLKEALHDTKVVLIENEFGEIGIDGGFLKESGVEMKEMNSGCICCSLVGDFGASLQEVLTTYAPDRILIEPSGVGKLSDVIRAVQNVKTQTEVSLSSAVVVVDASKCKMYAKNFGEFFLNQIENAGLVILSRTGNISEEKTSKAVEIIREHNRKAVVITTPWDQLDGAQILQAMEEKNDWMAELLHEIQEQHEHHDHEHHHDHECGHEHHHDHEECGHEHHHDHECGHDHDHHHEHEHGENCTCGCHDHDHHHHHADEVFTSWGKETAASYTGGEIKEMLHALEDEKTYGMILRAKGMLPDGNGKWTYFDYVPGEIDIREGKADLTGKICVIGSGLSEDKLQELFAK